jgi:cell wall-associated NlpC family hydrolase
MAGDDGTRFSGPAIGSVAMGALLVFAGVKGYSLATAVQDVVQGKNPLSEPQSNPIVASTAAAAGSAAALGSASSIAADAAKYVGKERYVWGGDPDTGGTDCSGFVNWVCGNDLGLAIPGYAPGAYHGASHGPIVAQWIAWSGCTTVSHNGSDAEAGDIVCFGPDTHMGIATGPNAMLSDQDPALGVGPSAINGLGLGFVWVRRYTAAPLQAGAAKEATL